MKKFILIMCHSLFLFVSVSGQSKIEPSFIKEKMQWFADAKLGIFIHWGIYSVPGWAVPQKNLCGIPKSYVNSPYSEWYLNMLRIKGSPVWNHHLKTYGPDFSYDAYHFEKGAWQLRINVDARNKE